MVNTTMNAVPAPDPGANVGKLVPALATRIVTIVSQGEFPVGHRLTEQAMCEVLGVSRSPVRKALQFLEQAGAVYSQPNRGYFVAKTSAELRGILLPVDTESDEATYLQIADDRLNNVLGDEVSEAELMQRYDMSRAKVQRVLNRMSREGIVERKPGRGWIFGEILSTIESYRESYRFRMTIEPAAILEPTFTLDMKGIDRCRKEQNQMLEGGIEKWSRSELFRVGANLHETIVGCSGNRFFIDAARNVNQLRRVFEYKANLDRSRLQQQCEEHLMLLDLLVAGERMEASHFLRQHLNTARVLKLHEENSAVAPTPATVASG